MATWTSWTAFQIVLENGATNDTAWNNENNLVNNAGEADHDAIEGAAGEVTNLLIFYVPDIGLSDQHRLRTLEWRIEVYQGTSVEIDFANGYRLYTNYGGWKSPTVSGLNTFTLHTWTGDPASWGLSTVGDGAGAMASLRSSFRFQFRGVKLNSNAPDIGRIRNAEFRFEYDDPVPSSGGLLTGCL